MSFGPELIFDLSHLQFVPENVSQMMSGMNFFPPFADKG